MSESPTPAQPSHRRKRSLSRRGMMAAGGAVAAGTALTPMVFAAGDSGGTDNSTSDSGGSGTTPEKFPATRTEAATGTGEATTAFPASYVGVRWSGAKDGAAIRLADGNWQNLAHGCATAEDGGTALVAADNAKAYEVKATSDINGVRSLAIDTTDGPERTYQVPSEPTRARGVGYLSRPAWGADESKRYKDGKVNSPETYYPLQIITVHHTATPNDDPDPAATVRAIYEFHAITNDWGDIGYHFLIDEAGTVYESRYSGDDGIPAFNPDGDLVTGFHSVGYNSGALGIALIGNLDQQAPTDAAKASLIRLIKVISRFEGLDPQARVTYTNPVNGTKKDTNTVGGHRDYFDTECPGQVMYDLLAEVRAAAARR
ncbi:peptidoglycan recognition family protein [Streptomyces sp. NPDC048384]|uniref:peptidoglycan recognition protein family protein n=1 Tax=Streptomyces sp. NPDC048384 TaxID=3155487 RepID=UPI00343A3079